VNICPFQGSRTIRTEEAVLIGLAKLSPMLSFSVSNPKAGRIENLPTKQRKGASKTHKVVADPPPVSLKFSDSEPSDESDDD
jgi:Putative RNA methyltransferase